MANFQPGRAHAPVSQVEITVSCRNLRDRDLTSKSDPMVVLYMKDTGSSRYIEIGRTERIKNCLSPDFARKFLIDYYFEQVQTLKFEVYDIDSDSAALNAHDFLGRLECSLGEIIGARGSKIHKNLAGHHGNSRGSMILCAEEVGGSKEIALMQWKGMKLDKKDFLGKSDPFMQIFRLEPDGSTTLAYRSEVIQNTLNPVWKPFRVPVRALCGDNIDRAVRFECYDWDNDGGQAHDLIGTFETTYRTLSQGANKQENIYNLINPKKKAKKKDYKNSGQLQLSMFSVETENSFLEFIRGGTQLHFSVAVDFTASNGDPNDPRSLHYINPQYPNQYMIAIKAVGDIIQDYDNDKMFPALGFGARLPPDGTLSHEFFLNFTNDPHCFGVNGILDAYRRTLTSVQLYGPTNFSPVINHVARFAANARDGGHYFVLLIITDGAITDMDNTVASIINASVLPMSIIIVGVGNADFTAMEILDADKGRLQQGGRAAQRDIVQFVPMRNYVNGVTFELSQARLAKEVMAEVPRQLTTYMKQIGIKPRPPVQVDASQLAPGPAPPFAPGAPPTVVPGEQPIPTGGQPIPTGGQPIPSGGPPQASSGTYPPPGSNYPQQPYPGMPPAGAHGQQPYPTPGAPGGHGQQPYPTPGAPPVLAHGQQPYPAPGASQGQQPYPSYPPTGGPPSGQQPYPSSGYPSAPSPYGQQPSPYPAPPSSAQQQRPYPGQVPQSSYPQYGSAPRAP